MGIKARKLADGSISYAIGFRWQGKDQWEHAGKDKRAAVRLLARRKKEVKDGAYVPRALSPITTTGQHLRAWCDKRDNRNAESEIGFIDRYVLTRQWFADLPIMDVRPRHVIQLVDELKTQVSASTSKPLGPKTVANIHGTLRTAFRDAVIAELAASNPCVLPKGKLKRAPNRERQPYSLADVHALTSDAVQIDRRIWNALAFYTGMREGEVCGRRWRDWDREAQPLGCITIETQYNDQPLKKEDQPRKAPVHSRLAELLEWWRTEGFEAVHLRAPTEDDFIVPNRDGSPHTKSSAYKAWRKALIEANVKNKSLHSTRHTFITLTRRGGADKDVVERITHNARGTIVDQYTHRDWNELCEAVLCFDGRDGVGARVGARDDNPAENKWRRRESNHADSTGKRDKRRKLRDGKGPPGARFSAAFLPKAAKQDARTRYLVAVLGSTLELALTDHSRRGQSRMTELLREGARVLDGGNKRRG